MLARLFAATIFVSAALLFLMQLIFARLVLPRLGGAPAVWLTCVVFFQAALFAGYGYAHWGPAWLGLKRHTFWHMVLLLLVFVALPIAVPIGWTRPDDWDPVPVLLGLLAAAVGLPFFVISASGPLLQRWYAATSERQSGDPYFLYAASNLGSLSALLGYPIVVEPLLSLQRQSQVWSAGYVVLVLLFAVCAAAVWRTKMPRVPRAAPAAWLVSARPSAWVRGWWVAAAFVPSSLMLSVTNYLTTDVAPIPLLWVIPLAVYLLSFVVAFSARPWVPLVWMSRILPLTVLLVALVIVSEATEPLALVACLHLLVLLIAAMVCHGALANSRPSPERLTEFYLWMSLGGMLGGLFNAIAAPLVFPMLIEYPLMLVAACLFRPTSVAPTSVAPTSVAEPSPSLAAEAPKVEVIRRKWTTGPWLRWPDLAWPAALALAIVALGQLLPVAGQARLAFIVAPSAVVCYTFLSRPPRFALGIGALLLSGGMHSGVHGRVVARERSFFGVHRVTVDGEYHQLVNGNTVHGRQSQAPAQRFEPSSYYHRGGPIGQVFQAMVGRDERARVAVVGLGAGSLAAYGEPGQRFTFFEIDPTVVRLAQDPRYFTFLSDCRATVVIVVGDARLTMAAAPPDSFDLIVLDAFSSDSIPLHLITREAVRGYTQKLAVDGVLAFHISNRYLDLAPVLSDLAADARFACWDMDDRSVSTFESQDAKAPSHWVVMARRERILHELIENGSWGKTLGTDGRPPWSDDFSNVFLEICRTWSSREK